MKSLVAAFAFLALVALPGPAAAQTHSQKSAKTDLHVSDQLIVGAKVLKTGDYTFQCVEIDGKTYLVVTSRDDGEVARVPCEPETLSAKVATSEFFTTTRDGKRYLTGVRIKGETVAHRVVAG